jgi:hypothetical protein
MDRNNGGHKTSWAYQLQLLPSEANMSMDGYSLVRCSWVALVSTKGRFCQAEGATPGLFDRRKPIVDQYSMIPTSIPMVIIEKDSPFQPQELAWQRPSFGRSIEAKALRYVEVFSPHPVQ